MRIKGNWLGTYPRMRGLLLVMLLLMGCIQRAPITPPAPTAQPALNPAISVAGNYDTAVTLAENSCGEVTVAAMPTQVEHEPGTSPLFLTHAGNRFSGALQPDATFSTDPLVLHSGSETYTVTVQGQFALTGFDAQTTVAVQQTRAPQSCQYTVAWVGTKQGPLNVIP